MNIIKRFFSELFKLIYVDKNYKAVPVDNRQLGTWELKHRYLGLIALIILIPFILIIITIILILKFILDILGVTDPCS